MQEWAAHFVCVADEVGRLQSGADAECLLFQKVAEQGHYAGRTVPTATRQGTYALAPSGVLLASVNSNDPAVMAELLQSALQRWESLPRAERFQTQLPPAREAARRWETRFEDIDLVLRVNSRDLPRESDSGDWRSRSWNQDFAWFRREEARQFLPTQLALGARHQIPAPLVQRLARAHLVDNVRGQTSSFPASAVQTAALTATVTAVDAARVSLRLEGATRTEQRGRWSIRGFRDMHAPSDQVRGYEAKLLGFAVFDRKADRFSSFEMVAMGMRWGATQYNGRADDLAPAPMGVAFTLASPAASELVAPAFIGDYGWQARESR